MDRTFANLKTEHFQTYCRLKQLFFFFLVGSQLAKRKKNNPETFSLWIDLFHCKA